MMIEGMLQGQLAIFNNKQNNIQNQNDQLVLEEDRYVYFDNYIKQISNQQIWTAQISNDEKYLAIGRKNQKIYIYYLKNKKIVKMITQHVSDSQLKIIQIIKFSNNSRQLISGDNYGFLCCFDINNNFKIIYNQKIHSKFINDIFTIDDDQILTCSDDLSLIITNIKNDQQLLKIKNAHTSMILGIDYDKSNDFIISCSYDNSIKFFNNGGQLKIEQQSLNQRQGCGIFMIQLISKDNNLISSDNEQLTIWQIEYQKLQLNKIKEFNCRIYNFTSVLNNNKIVVISEESVHILDNNLKVLQSIKLKINSHTCIITRQINSINYIIIPGFHNLVILKKFRKVLK